MRTPFLTLCLLGGAHAAQVTVSNTATLHLNGTTQSSNTVELQQGAACAPSLAVDGAAGTQGVTLGTPGTGFIPYTLRQTGAAGEVTLTASVLPDSDWTPGLAVFLDADRDGQPDGPAPTRLSLAEGETRALLLGVSAGREETGTARVNLAAACGGRRDDDNPVSVRAQAAQARLLLDHSPVTDVARVGDRVPFTLSLPNPLAEPLPVTLVTELPDTALYVPTPGDGAPTVDGRVLTWHAVLPASGRLNVTYHVHILSARENQVTLTAVAHAVVKGEALHSEPDHAQVLLEHGPFDARGTLIGQVFYDENDDGRPGAGEPPVAGARVVLSNGLQTLTDAGGRYTFRNLAPGPWLVGVDRGSLPGEPVTPRRTVDVFGLARADFGVRPGAATPAAAVPAAPSPATGRDGLIRRPQAGTVLRGGNKTAVSVEGPADQPFGLTLNGVPVPDSLVGLRGPGTAPGSVRLDYVGVPLAEGANVLEARFGERRDRLEVTVVGTPRRLVLRPVRLVADGHSPLVVEVAALDAAGREGGEGFVTVGTDLEPAAPDAAPGESGYQVALRGGVARVTLAPLAAGREFTLRAALGELTAGARLYASPGGNTFGQYQGSAGVRVEDGRASLTGRARAYVERPLAGGQLRAALDTGGLPRAGDFSRFPVTGSGTEAQMPLRSDDGFAVRYDRANLSLGYYAAPLALPGLDTLPAGSAARVEVRGPLRVQAFAGAVSGESQVEEFPGGGGRTYRLRFPARAGSEQVIVRSGGRERVLTPGQEYVLGPGGTLVLAAPLAAYDADFAPVRLVVAYAPAGGARNVLAFGVGAQYSRGPWSFGLGAARLGEWAYGASAAYRTPELSASAAYRRDPLGPAGRLTAEVQGERGGFGVNASLSLNGGERPLGTAGVSYRTGENRVALRQNFGVAGARTEATFERRFGAVSLGLGADYDWPTGTFGVLGLGRYVAGRSAVEVVHSQAFGVRAPETRLSAAYQLSDTLSAQARVRQVWGVGPSGEIGLSQRVGSSNFSATYQLPGAAGEASRARFGLEVPLTLSERWDANVGASLDRDLGTGALGGTLSTGVRYHTDAFVATLGAEYGLSAGTGRLTLRGGATGQVGEGQTLSLDASLNLLPTAEGQFTVSYALRRERYALLTSHRLHGGTARALEGEVQANLALRPGLDLQPTLAYRVPLAHPAGSSAQLGLGATVALTEKLGVGATGYLLWQPALNTWSGAFGVDARYRLTEPVWLVAGYTWGGFSALTDGARRGYHFRFDFAGGTP